MHRLPAQIGAAHAKCQPALGDGPHETRRTRPELAHTEPIVVLEQSRHTKENRQLVTLDVDLKNQAVAGPKPEPRVEADQVDRDTLSARGTLQTRTTCRARIDSEDAFSFSIAGGCSVQAIATVVKSLQAPREVRVQRGVGFHEMNLSCLRVSSRKDDLTVVAADIQNDCRAHDVAELRPDGGGVTIESAVADEEALSSTVPGVHAEDDARR